MKGKNKRILFIVLLVGLGVVFILWGFWRKWQIEKSHQISSGRIYNYYYGGRGNAGHFFIDFILNIQGKEYKGSSTYLMKDFDCDRKFIGKTFPVVYNPDNPSTSSILIIPEDFSRYGYSFPDSLKWVLQYKK